MAGSSVNSSAQTLYAHQHITRSPSLRSLLAVRSQRAVTIRKAAAYSYCTRPAWIVYFQLRRARAKQKQQRQIHYMLRCAENSRRFGRIALHGLHRPVRRFSAFLWYEAYLALATQIHCVQIECAHRQSSCARRKSCGICDHEAKSSLRARQWTAPRVCYNRGHVAQICSTWPPAWLLMHCIVLAG